MPLLGLLISAALFWAYISGKLRGEEIPSIILALLGGFMTIRGEWIAGLAALAFGAIWYRGIESRLAKARRAHDIPHELSTARTLLGVSEHADPDVIRASHRALIAQHHPDRGGTEAQAQALNKARDLLLHDLLTKNR